MADVNVGSLPHHEAIKYFQQKLLIPSRQWNDLLGPIHAKAFTIAGVTQLSLLQDFFGAIHNSILDGTTITDFRKDFDNFVARHGWSYKGKRGWRTDTMFFTNKRSALMAGKWAQMWRMKDRRPYLMYLTVDDSRVRPEHKKWHRLILHIDDPAWKQIYPPNGFRCRCIVRSLSKADLEAMGVTPDKIGKIETVDWEDPVTGEIIKRTPGIDIGWDYNVGQSWLAPEVLLGQQLMEIPADLRKLALEWFNNDIYDKPFSKLVNKVAYQLATSRNISAGHALPIGYLSDQVIKHLASNDSYPIGATLIARDSDIAHWLRDTKAAKGKTVPLNLAADLPKLIREPDAILWDSLNPSLIYAKKLDDGRYAKFVVKVNMKGKLQHNKSRFNEFLNTVKSAGIVKGDNLKEGRYQLIEGKIE